MFKKFIKLSTILLAMLLMATMIAKPVYAINNMPNDNTVVTYGSDYDGGGGIGTPFNPSKEPPSDVGFERDRSVQADKKFKNPKTGSYGYRDSKGRYWVPDLNMHGGEGWTREWSDGSHDHVYPDGNVRKHKGNGKANFSSSGTNWIVIVGLGILTGIAILTPIPGDEIIVGGILLGL